MATQVVYSPEFNNHNTIGHPENAKRLEVMMHAFNESPLSELIEIIPPTLLPEQDLSSVHSEEMIQQIKDFSAIGDTWIDLDTYVSKNDYTTARLAAGALLTLAKNVMNGKATNGFAPVRPPGHHATHERSMGFCLFNNAAITAHYLTTKGYRVLIVDHDVLHGNGTQYIFYDRRDVMYQSFHLSPHYPGTGAITEIGQGAGEGYTINAPASYGTGDATSTTILEEIFLPIAHQFKPDLIIVSAGYDSHHADPLGGMKLTANFYSDILTRYQKIQPKIVCTLEGGYNLSWIDKCFLAQLGQLSGNPQTVEDAAEEKQSLHSIIGELKELFGGFWKL